MKNLLRNVAYASVILAATTSTVHNLSTSAHASGMNAGRIVAYSGFTALTDDGQLFYLDVDNWKRNCDVGAGPNSVPIPVSRIAFLGEGGKTFIDTDGNGWGWYGGCPQGPWINDGPPPGYQPIPVRSTTWSEVKTIGG